MESANLVSFASSGFGEPRSDVTPESTRPTGPHRKETEVHVGEESVRCWCSEAGLSSLEENRLVNFLCRHKRPNEEDVDRSVRDL